VTVFVAEKYGTLQKITRKRSLPLLVDHVVTSRTRRKRSSVGGDSGVGGGGVVTPALGTLLLKELRDMRFLAFNFVRNGNAGRKYFGDL